MDLRQIYENTVAGNVAQVKELTEQALLNGAEPGEIISEYLMPAMAEVGTVLSEATTSSLSYAVPRVPCRRAWRS